MTTTVVLGYGAVAPRVFPPSAVTPNLAVAGASVLAARRGGRSWAELGLDPSRAARGLAAGTATIPPIATVAVTIALIPKLRALLHDERVLTLSGREAVYHLVVRIPLATALAEEVIFRGALLGLAGVGRRRWVAVAWTSVAFGLWHVLPAMHSHRRNPHGARLAEDRGGAGTVIAATVVATAAAGAALAVLRLRARSTAAPVVAHAAANGLLFLVARAAGRRNS